MFGTDIAYVTTRPSGRLSRDDCQPRYLYARAMRCPLNVNVHTFEVAPVFTVLVVPYAICLRVYYAMPGTDVICCAAIQEEDVIKKLCSTIGYNAATSGGLFVPGTSLCVRYAKYGTDLADAPTRWLDREHLRDALREI
eukprot:433759-Rhodomonas_salina.1